MSADFPPAVATVDPRVVNRKAMLRIVPVIFVLYVIAYLDRVNVSFTQEQLQARLALNDADFSLVYGWGTGIFFTGYLLLEIPGALLVEHWSARKWFCRILITWGFCSMAMVLVRTPWQFYLVRFLLGLAEAGFFPGIIVYFTHWFPREDRGRAFAGMVLGIPISLALGARVSSLLLDVHWFGIEGWQWVFILEGAPAVLMGLLVPFLLTDRPHQASWLTPGESNWLVAKLSHEKGAAGTAGRTSFPKPLEEPSVLVTKLSHEKGAAEPAGRTSFSKALKEPSMLVTKLSHEKGAAEPAGRTSFLKALKQPTVWLLALGIFSANTGGYAAVFWLPRVVKNFLAQAGFDSAGNAHLNWLALAYAFGLAGIWLSGLSSDRTASWKWHCVGAMVLTGACLTATAIEGQRWQIVIVWLCLMQFFAFAWPPPFWVLPTLTLSSTEAAFAIGFINICANLAGQVGSPLVGVMKYQGYDDRVCLMVLAGFFVLGGIIVSLIRIPQTPLQKAPVQ
jgi:MFS family permease